MRPHLVEPTSAPDTPAARARRAQAIADAAGAEAVAAYITALQGALAEAEAVVSILSIPAGQRDLIRRAVGTLKGEIDKLNALVGRA